MADNLGDIWDGKHRKKKRKEGGGYWEKSWVWFWGRGFKVPESYPGRWVWQTAECADLKVHEEAQA